MEELRSVPCVFIKSNLIVVCHVDDLIIFGKAKEGIKIFENRIQWDLKIKDLENQDNFREWK